MVKALLVPALVVAILAPASFAAAIGQDDVVSGNLCLVKPGVQWDPVRTTLWFVDSLECSVENVIDSELEGVFVRACAPAACSPLGVSVASEDVPLDAAAPFVPRGVRVAALQQIELLP